MKESSETHCRCHYCYKYRQERHDTPWHCKECQLFICHTGLPDTDCFLKIPYVTLEWWQPVRETTSTRTHICSYTHASKFTDLYKRRLHTLLHIVSTHDRRWSKSDNKMARRCINILCIRSKREVMWLNECGNISSLSSFGQAFLGKVENPVMNTPRSLLGTTR